MSEARVQERSRADDDAGQNPIADTRHVLRELIRRRDADPRECEQRHRDAEVGRIQEMARAVCNRRAQDALRADRHDGGEDDWSECLVGVQEHRAGEPADVRREHEIDELAWTATEEPERAAIESRVDDLQQQFGTVSCGQGHEGMCPRLFEAKESMAQDVQDSDGDCKASQPAQAVRPIVNLMRTH